MDEKIQNNYVTLFIMHIYIHTCNKLSRVLYNHICTINIFTNKNGRTYEYCNHGKVTHEELYNFTNVRLFGNVLYSI